MEFLQNPNYVYILLVGGLSFAVLALAAPGTGFLEIGAIFIMGAAGWSIITYNMPVNWWAIAAIVVGAVLFVVAMFRTRGWLLLAAGVILVVGGSVFLFQGERWYTPALNPIVAGAVAITSGGFFWLVGRKAIQAALVRPTHDLGGLIGKTGEAKTDISDNGSVQVDSELWSARSEQPVEMGERVRVVGREGFILLVEPLQKE